MERNSVINTIIMEKFHQIMEIKELDKQMHIQIIQDHQEGQKKEEKN